ncbi:piwi-like protein 1 [Gastrophryne carolinensis]
MSGRARARARGRARGQEVAVPGKHCASIIVSATACRFHQELEFLPLLPPPPPGFGAHAGGQKYEDIMHKELKTWWDLSSLTKYVQNAMIPRGLRIRKVPATIYSENFQKEWNTILTNASMDLMRLIITHEEEKLKEIQKNIVDLENSFKQFESIAHFEDNMDRLRKSLDTMEAQIMEIKRNKYQRDTDDYRLDRIYTWKRASYRSFRPRSILKSNTGKKSVTFNTSESSDWSSTSDRSDTELDFQHRAMQNQEEKEIQETPQSGAETQRMQTVMSVRSEYELVDLPVPTPPLPGINPESQVALACRLDSIERQLSRLAPKKASSKRRHAGPIFSDMEDFNNDPFDDPVSMEEGCSVHDQFESPPSHSGGFRLAKNVLASAEKLLPGPEKPAALPETEIVGRGRQKSAPPATRPKTEELAISAGFQDISIGDRGGRRRDCLDIGVCTRKSIAHVIDSKTGVSGKSIQLCTNHVKLVVRPQWALYQYHIDYNPPMESRSLRSALLYQHDDLIGKARAFDGTILFLPKRLNKISEVLSQTRNGENVKITITLTNELPPTSPTCFHFYNIIFRRLLKMMNMKQIGRNYYNPGDHIDIRTHNLTVWPGFTTSILQYETDIMLCIDVSHKVLRSETVLDVMYNLFSKVPESNFYDICSKELIGQIVLTKYNNRTYRIDDINWDFTPESTFKKSDGNEISFIDYYKTQYNKVITDLKQPAIVHNPKKTRGPTGAPPGPIFLIPEFCFLTGLTDKMRSDFNVMKDLAIHTRLAPEQREKQVGRFLDCIHRDDNVQKELKDWGLDFDNKLLSFSGRVAPPEKILQSNKAVEYNPQFADWSRELRGPTLIHAKHLDDWILIYARRNYDAANSLTQNLFKVSQQMGINMNKAVMIEVDDNTDSYVRALQQNVHTNTQMVVCLLSSNRKDRYDAIKKFLCVDRPVPSQCVIARTLSKPQTILSVAVKIALQMNCKMGGELWSVEIPLKEMMIVGIDCYHDTLAGKRSIGAFVASLNQGMTRWFSRCVLQDQKQEIVDGLKVCMQAALNAWHSYNKSLPSRIIIYRDGVGDGQLKTVVNYEIAQLMDCITATGTDYNPRLSVIVVKKRINTRFFAQLGGKLQNPPPGTIIDVEVTRPEWYDFFIVSQSVRQGTVSPTHYNVVYDSGALKPDHMQRLTYKLCHLYYNWPGVIRVPAPCQYAHKLAFLVGQSIHREPHPSMSDRLFYL